MAASNPPTAARAGTPWRDGLLALVAIVIVWSMSTLFFGGDLGKLSDDYGQNSIDPVTGRAEWPGMPWTITGYFWRPLHIAVVYALGTAFGSSFWIAHAITALAFLAAAIALWRFVVEATGRIGPATAAALPFCVFPLNREVMLWPAAISYSLASVIFLALCIATVRAARVARIGRLTALSAVAGLAIPCLNEQPATGLPLIALLYVAATPRGNRRRALGRALVPAAAAVAGTVLYLGLYLGTVPDALRGGATSFVALSDAPERAAAIARSVGDGLTGTRVRTEVLGGIAHGWPAVQSARGAAWLAAMAIALAFAVWRWGRGRREAGEAKRSLGWWLVAFGIAQFALAWAPIVMIAGQDVPPRVFTFPLLGLAIAVAALLERVDNALAVHPPTRRVARTFVVATVAVVGVGGAITLVGWQRMMRDTHALDRRIAGQLVALIPDPPPTTVFVPLRNDGSVAATGMRAFDLALAGGALSAAWSADRVLREAYRRNDLYGGAYHPWIRNFEDANAWEVRVKTNGGPFERTGEFAKIPWHISIPFVVDRHGTVKIVERVAIHHLDEETARVAPPLTSTLRTVPARHREPLYTLRLPFAKVRRRSGG